MFFEFHNTYSKLPENFYQKTRPIKVSNPRLLYFNNELADSLGIQYNLQHKEAIAHILSGNTIPDNSDPIALAYAGHQFGVFVPKLGDGRAILLGEILDKNNQRFDVQLKGSGITAYSRDGDGKAGLGPIIREYIISQGMHNLGIKTTRSLAIVSTGEEVLRNGQLLPGAILTRIAKSHVRIGTFEYFASRGDINSLKILADYIINRHYPEIKDSAKKYVSLFECIQNVQINLIVDWMRVGFIHGVMNTDNMSIIGDTLDYGPCAFLDEYDPDKVFSSIDYQGRYSFSNQSQICHWNLMQLAKCLALIIDDDLEKGLELLYPILTDFEIQYQQRYNAMMLKKIGIKNVNEDALLLLMGLLNIMYQEELDYTLTFRHLCYTLYDQTFDYSKIYIPSITMKKWIDRWMKYLDRENISIQERLDIMLRANPAIIPRNHKIEEAIKHAIEYNDLTKVDAILKVLSNPYNVQPQKEDITYMLGPKPNERIYQTFCGT